MFPKLLRLLLLSPLFLPLLLNQLFILDQLLCFLLLLLRLELASLALVFSHLSLLLFALPIFLPALDLAAQTFSFLWPPLFEQPQLTLISFWYPQAGKK